MRVTRLILCDLDPRMIDAWDGAFGGSDVEIQQRSLTDHWGLPGLRLATAGNSYGIMNGGLDLAVARRFPGLDDRVLGRLLNNPQPVGWAGVFPTGDADVPEVVYAPTMVRPADVSASRNAYLAMTAILKHASFCTVVPGLCAGVGRMPHLEVARQMHQAFGEYAE